MEKLFNWTKKEKLKLGLEIVAGMKASAYKVSLEEGRLMALEFTEPKENASQVEIDFCKIEKEKLINQALFIADVTLKKINEMMKKMEG